MSDDSSSDDSNSSGFLGGVNELVDRLTELAEAAESLDAAVEKGGSTDDDSDVDGVWGVRVRTNIGGEDLEFSEFGNVRDDESDTVVVDDVREPMVDVFEEDDEILIVAEMPGAAPGDLRMEVEGDLMILGAETDSANYRRELLLPADCSECSPDIRANNGIFEIRLVPDEM